jgi:protease I
MINPDILRTNPKAVAFVKAFFASNNPVMAICHGPWMIIQAGAARGRRMASWPSLRTDLRNAGAEWVDQEVVVDGNLVSSRKPDDIPEFNREMLKLLSAPKHSSSCANRREFPCQWRFGVSGGGNR